MKRKRRHKKAGTTPWLPGLQVMTDLFKREGCGGGENCFSFPSTHSLYHFLTNSMRPLQHNSNTWRDISSNFTIKVESVAVVYHFMSQLNLLQQQEPCLSPYSSCHVMSCYSATLDSWHSWWWPCAYLTRNDKVIQDFLSQGLLPKTHHENGFRGFLCPAATPTF